MFTFLHAADIHLDSPLKGLEQYEGAPVEEIRNASRRALDCLVQTAVDEQVAFVLIAGDLYDGDWRDYNTGLYFVSQMARLREAEIPVFVVAGNHDAANRMTRSLKLPENVQVLGYGAPETVILDDVAAAIHGQSYATGAVREDLSQGYPSARPGLFNIGLLHTCASGREGHQPYAPCTVEGLRGKGYQYWALGHVHKRESLCDDPLIEFPGNIQGRYIRETGPKGCLLVTAADDLTATAEFTPLDVLRWQDLAVDVSNLPGGDEILDHVAGRLQDLQKMADGRFLAIRVTLSGRSAAHAQLLAQRHRWTNEIRARAVDIGDGTMWVEKVQIGTMAPEHAARAEPMGDSPIGEISSLIGELRSAPERLREFSVDLATIARAIPGEVKECTEIGQFDDPTWLVSILDEANFVLRDYLLERHERP